MALAPAHTGFFIPNAKDVTAPGMAEPDRIDFSTLGNTRWGVIEGCSISIAGSTSSCPVGGTALVNGNLVAVAAGQQVNHGTGGTQDRYDLVGCDTNGVLKIIRGDPSNDPVFPDPDLNFTVFASVFCPTGTSNFAANVIDKRNMLPDSLKTKIPPANDLVVNRNGSGTLFRTTGDGQMSWVDETLLYRSKAFTLHVTKYLEVDQDITSLGPNGTVTGDYLVARKRVTAPNLNPSTTAPVGPNDPGSIWQDTGTGRIYVWRNGHWDELATLSSAFPVGSVITSMQDPSYMEPLGWVPLDGRTVSENDTKYASLFNVPTLVSQGNVTGVAPNRVMTLPNANRRVFLTDFSGAARVGGSNSLTLLVGNMPPHKHNSRTSNAGGMPAANYRTGRGGQHAHAVYGGEHWHTITDRPHQHPGMDFYGNNLQVITTFWGGNNKIDALFNDRSHTYSVEPLLWTGMSTTGITGTNTDGSWHAHTVDANGDHDHTVTVGAQDPHSHPITEDTVGSGQAIDSTPAYLSVFTYVRS